MASSTTVQIGEAPVAPGPPTALAQFKPDGTTALPVGAWTNQTTVVLRFTMTDASHTDSLVPEVEIKPVATAFDGSALRAGSAVASTGAPVQGSVTVSGLANAAKYHWRARVKDASGQASAWVSFGGNAETGVDVAVDTIPPTGSIKIDSAAWTETPSVSLRLACSDAKSGCSAMQLSNDNVAFTAPEPFATTRTWAVAAGNAEKTVYVRYLDQAGNVSSSVQDTITLDSAGRPHGEEHGQDGPVPRGQCYRVGGVGRQEHGPCTGVGRDPYDRSHSHVTATDRAGNTGAVARGTVVAQ